MTSFRELHESGSFVLPNAWDPASARLLSTVPGVPALGTTSAGVAAALGLPDGQRMPMRTMIEAVGKIVDASAVPVSADLEGGYNDVRATVRAAMDVGVVGVNIEDTRYPDTKLWSPEEAADRIARVRSLDAELVINARTDVWWFGDGGMDEGLTRMRLFLEAGADCLFAPGLPEKLIPEIIAALPGVALNVLASPTLPSLESLAAMGVRRVSTGSALARLAWGSARDALTSVLGGGGFAGIGGTLSYRDLTEALDNAIDP